MAKKSASKKVQYWGTGRRKKSIARVRLIPEGTGKIIINGKDINEYFDLETLKIIVKWINQQICYSLLITVISLTKWILVYRKWRNQKENNYFILIKQKVDIEA